MRTSITRVGFAFVLFLTCISSISVSYVPSVLIGWLPSSIQIQKFLLATKTFPTPSLPWKNNSHLVNTIIDAYNTPSYVRPHILVGAQGIGKSQALMDVITYFSSLGQPAAYVSLRDQYLALEKSGDPYARLTSLLGARNAQPTLLDLSDALTALTRKGYTPIIVVDDVQVLYGGQIDIIVVTDIIRILQGYTERNIAHILLASSEESIVDSLRGISGVQSRLVVLHAEDDPRMMCEYLLKEINSRMQVPARAFTRESATTYLNEIGSNLRILQGYINNSMNINISEYIRSVHNDAYRKNAKQCHNFTQQHLNIIDMVCKKWNILAEDVISNYEVVESLINANILRAQRDVYTWHSNLAMHTASRLFNITNCTAPKIRC